MRTVLCMPAMLAGVLCISLVPVKAAAQPMPVVAATKTQLAVVEEVGWRRRYYRGYAYPAPYAYYPPAYGYYPPPAYGYYAPAYPPYPYYRPYGYYRPYYAPY
jgi:hypothetical protein